MSKDRFGFGIVEWALPYNGQYGCQVAKQAGFDAIQIDLGNYTNNFPMARPEMIKIYMEQAEKWEITYPSMAITTLGKFGVQMTATQGTVGKQLAYMAIKKAIDTCDEMGIPLIMVPSFFDDRIKDEKDMEETVTCLKYAVDYADKKNITISTEAVLDAEKTIELIDRVGGNKLKVYFDTQNYKLFGNCNTVETFNQLLPYIAEIHVKDGNTRVSQTLLGDGMFEVKEIADAIKASNYSGWIMSENYYDTHMAPLSDDSFGMMAEDARRVKEFFRV